MPKPVRSGIQLDDTQIRNILCGIIIGDIAGSAYENGITVPEEEVRTVSLLENGHSFTDDSVMSLAVYSANQVFAKRKLKISDILRIYVEQYRNFAHRYPDCGFGAHFYQWAVKDIDDPEYQSYADGSAMRSGIIGAMYRNVKDVIKYSILSAMPTHAHPEGIKGAVVTSVLVWMAINGYSKQEMKQYILKYYPVLPETQRYFNPVHPDLTIKQLQENGKYQTFDLACRTAVPLAFINFFESEDYEECIRSVLRYSCDADTVAAISGGIAAAYYKAKEFQGKEFSRIAEDFLPKDLNNT